MNILFFISLFAGYASGAVCSNTTLFMCPKIPVNPAPGQVSGFAAFNYEADNPNTPENWGNLDCQNGAYAIFEGCSYCNNECGELYQSPVDVLPLEALSMSWIPTVEIETHTAAHLQYEISSGGFHLHCKEKGACGSATVGGEKYELLQVHTHTKSEHALNGTIYPAEMHLVHIRNGENILVIGIFFEEGEENEELEVFINTSSSKSAGDLNISKLLGDSIAKENLTLYSGSLTTPPCTEGVRWAVSSKVLEASASQLYQLFKLVGSKNNNRPLQPMRERVFLKL